MRLLLLIGCGLAFAGCQFPKDPEGTLNQVRERGSIKVGVTHHDPFVNLHGPEPAGVEVELIEGFADHLGVEVEWVEGSESQLVELLAGTEIDVMLAGLDRQSPLQKEVGFTRPYANVEIVVAVPPGEEEPNIEGLDVLVEENSEAASITEKETDADPIRVPSLENADGRPVVVEDYLLDELGYEKTGHSLKETEHCLAVPRGENAWLVELERYLLDQEAVASDLLREEGTL
ncbi:MAG TPA: transporter substrate-binding domain-containing protein [Thermoleophilaceae bacterium]|nr:transporter substrate-binding domain-containing protein [Thermoleophilaceae bacterium]